MKDWYENLPFAEALSPDEAKELQTVLGNKVFRKAAANILERADGILERLAVLNLLSNEGVMEGIKLQTERRMCIQFFDDLLTQAQERNNDNAG
jgi:hypothetical protein